MAVGIMRQKSDGVTSRLFVNEGGANVDRKGRFVIEDLLPGEYELLLMVTRPPGLDPNSPDQPNPAPVRQKVVVTKGQETQVTLTIDLGKKEQEDD